MPRTPVAARAVADLLARVGQPAVELTASGSAAIEVGLELLGVGPGDEVIVPDIGCHSVAAAVLRRGGVPVFVGVGPSLTLGADDVAAAVTRRTRAVIAVHEFGLPCDVPGIVRAVPEVAVIEDLATAWGARARGRACGATGALAVTSFGPGKPVSLGAGGALFGPAPMVVGSVSRGDGREGQLPRPPSTARFPAPLLAELGAALDRADRALAARRAAVARFSASELGARFRLPPMPPESEASWSAVPLYPVDRLDAPLLGAVRRALGPIEIMPRVRPSALPMFQGFDKRVVPGPSRTDPLLAIPQLPVA